VVQNVKAPNVALQIAKVQNVATRSAKVQNAKAQNVVPRFAVLSVAILSWVRNEAIHDAVPSAVLQCAAIRVALIVAPIVHDVPHADSRVAAAQPAAP
jgi:hypothetical protein